MILKTKLIKILMTGLCCVLPFTASATESAKQPLSVEGLYKHNEKAFGYIAHEGSSEKVYVITREDIPCFINFKTMLSKHGTEKTVKIIPVLAKIGFDEEKLEKNNFLLYFYSKALKKENIGFPLIVTKQKDKVIISEGCPDEDKWNKYF